MDFTLSVLIPDFAMKPSDAVVPKAKVAVHNPRDWIQSADIDGWGRELCDLLFANWLSYTLAAKPKGFKLAEVANIDLTLVSGDLTRTVTLTGSYGLIPKTLIVGKVQV
jgi:hypothetical protein